MIGVVLKFYFASAGRVLGSGVLRSDKTPVRLSGGILTFKESKNNIIGPHKVP